MRKTCFSRLLLMAVLCSILPLQGLYADNSEKALTGTLMGSDENGRSWVGLDLGTPYVIERVGWCPQEGASEQGSVVLGLFEGSNREDFMDAIPLYMIKEEGTVGEFSYANVRVTRGFRYVRWCAPADTNSDVAEVEFYGYAGVGNDSRFYQLTNLPTLSYHTYSGQEPYDKIHELESEMCLIYDGGTRIQEYPILARERGNGSRYELFKKRPYRIKFNDGKSHHMLKDSPLESPAKAKKWTLIPNWRDKSLMRNNVAFEMSRRLGLAYTPWIQNVDVIVNGEYKGNYQLCDQITVDPNRVDIYNMESWDVDDSSISGGYLLEITSPGGEAYHFSSSHGIPVDVKSPDADDIMSEQFSYIMDAFNEMESKLWADNYQHSEKGYRSRLDIESFLRYFLVGEFSGNNDAMWSIYLYKERDDDLFHFGPVWDFDLSMDNDQRTYPANGKPDWLFNYGSAVNGIRDFVRRILSDPYANERLASIWSDLRESGAFSQDSLWAFVDSLGNVLDESQELNFTRWDNLDQLLTLQQFAPGTYQGELDIIKNYLNERIRWIDKKLGYKDYDDDDVSPTDTLFAISSPQDFLKFQRAVNYQGLTSLNGRLDADLDLSSVSSLLEPIGMGGNIYTGTFDGQGHTISGLTMRLSSNYVGLFGIVGGGASRFAGMIALFLMMSRMFANNVNQFSQQIIFIVMGMAGASRCLDLLDEKPEVDKGYVYLCNVIKKEDGSLEETSEHTHDYAWKYQHKDGHLEYRELKGDIVLDNVDFSYDGNRLVLEDVSIYAHPGQKIAFVGATGAGKTTITNLINRFYDIADGKIRYDGININKIKKADLRKSLGIVLQDTNLFTGTVMENIRYGRLEASDEECINAAKIANAHDFIMRLPEGYNTLLSGDGSNLSQGQRQLLSIARAAVADAPVMILDEATSSIDTRTEKLVQQGTDQLMKGRTVFVIAHRLSTVQNSNAIMVLDHGHIIERGTHDDLIKQKGVYYSLYTGAFELE